MIDGAYRRKIGELTASVGGTKFLLQGQTSFFRGDLESDHLKRPHERQTFGWILKYFFHLYGKVNYVFYCIIR